MGLSEKEAFNILKDKYKPPVQKKAKKRIKPVKHRHDGKMTKTELEYAQIFLEPQLRASSLVRYEYERKTFILANGCSYTPDFWCVFENHIEIHEIKGGHEENKGLNSRDGKTRWKIAAQENPEFVWKYCRRLESGEWKVEEYLG